MILGTLSAVLVIRFMINRNKDYAESLLKNQEDLEQRSIEITNKNRELQKANEELDKFVYSASHDLRAPLTTLLGLIEVFKLSENEEERHNFLNMMTSRIEDMEGFISDITDYSRNSRMEVVHLPVKMSDFLKDIKTSFEFLSNEAGVKISIDADTDIEYKTDPGRLKVAVNNVVANAIKYSDRSKDKRFVNISLDKEERGIVIVIEDNGIGIPEEHHSKIFDMFFRASANSKGSGLGLYIVREALEKINGKISFSSELNTGSKFTIELFEK
jgi:signal transduction histidine kinase